MSYNLTRLANSQNFYDLVVYANDSSEQVLVGLFLFAFFFIFILLFKRFGMDKAIAGSSFICFMLSLTLSYAHLVSFYVVTAFFVILAFAVLYLYTAGNKQ